MRIASGQFGAGTDSRENLRLIARLMEVAALGNADLLVLPESSLYAGTGGPSAMAEVAEPLDGPFISGVGALARDLNLPVVVGTTEASHGGLPYNTIVALDARGEVLGTYRKVHLYDAFGHRESDGTRPGSISAPYLLSHGQLRLGMLTCYDLRFPESARYLVDAGANVLLLPANWIRGPGKEDHFNTLVRARAIENTSYVVAANQCGPFATAYSMVVDPFGVVIVNAGEGPGVVFAELEPERIAAVRTRVPALQNRRFTVIPKHSD
ncbi:carbon-nitrogen hydrolase family protein [Arthrobacter sp. MPF02]|uniref:carbon-nitrogen hydrolase family protein n=1 Tax=Arthrobacter sp. MPF02 TaxID=3388492 RepID=UPI003984E4BB